MPHRQHKAGEQSSSSEAENTRESGGNGESSGSQFHGGETGNAATNDEQRTAGEGSQLMARVNETAGNEVVQQLSGAALAAAAVALFEIELVPAVLIGAAATLAPKLLPGIGGLLRPFAKTAVKAGYVTITKARRAGAEVSEQMRDMVAEAKAEQQRSTSQH